ncbi:hypothetical protein NLC29_03545, partial [Candidatus Aminicenantes bacterium AH-873-B07]|nr:hypothetical protein [Candidatus Aminicenantes bacterium AH-873-B07]
MRILHCLHNYYPAIGGAEWLMKNISERLVERRYEVKVIATNAYSVEDYFLPGKGKNLMKTGEEEINGVIVKRVAFTRKGAVFLNLMRAIANRINFPGGDWFRMISWGPRSISYYKEILNSEKIDLISACPLPTLNVWYAWKVSKKKNIPFIIVPCFHTEDKFTFHNKLYFK